MAAIDPEVLMQLLNNTLVPVNEVVNQILPPYVRPAKPKGKPTSGRPTKHEAQIRNSITLARQVLTVLIAEQRRLVAETEEKAHRLDVMTARELVLERWYSFLPVLLRLAGELGAATGKSFNEIDLQGEDLTATIGIGEGNVVQFVHDTEDGRYEVIINEADDDGESKWFRDLSEKNLARVRMLLTTFAWKRRLRPGISETRGSAYVGELAVLGLLGGPSFAALAGRKFGLDERTRRSRLDLSITEKPPVGDDLRDRME